MSLRHLLTASLLSLSMIAPLPGLATATAVAAPAVVPPAPTPGRNWQPLAIAGGFRPDGRRFVAVSAAAGTFDALRFEAASGTTEIRQVVVQFTDGTSQIARRLAAEADGSRPFELAVADDPRTVKRVVVYGASVAADGSPGTFAVTARCAHDRC